MNERDGFAELFESVEEVAKGESWETVVRLVVNASNKLMETRGQCPYKLEPRRRTNLSIVFKRDK